MVERVIERGKEPEPKELAYELSYRLRAEFRKQRAEGKVVVHSNDIEWEQNRQGFIKYMSHDGNWKQQAVPYWRLFIHRIKRHSGKHTHQGGLGLFVLEGKGYTVVDGVRYDWEKDDLIILPVKPDGCEHQHFNADPSGKAAEWLAFIFIPYLDAMGAPLEQKEVSPEWKGATSPSLGHMG